MKVKITLCVLLSAILFSTATVSAQDDNNWDFELAPLYLWAINIEGDTGVRGKTGSTRVNFGDIWGSLEGVFTLRFNAVYKKKFGMIFDYNYLDLGTERGTDVVAFEVGLKSQIVNLAGTYRLLDGVHQLTGLAGIRYNALEVEIDFIGTGLGADADKDWADPIIGARYGYQLSDQWALQFHGDIGGFGVSSDFTWQALGLIDFQPWRHVAILAGYRAIGVDYASGSGSEKFTYDVTIHGPVAGIDIRF